MTMTSLQAQSPSQSVLATARSPDGTTLVTSHMGGTVAVWDLPTLRLRAHWSHPAGLSHLAVNPTATAMATAGPTPAPVWVYGTDGTPHGHYPGPQGRVDALAVSSDGQWLAIAGAPELPSGDTEKDARRYGPVVVHIHALSNPKPSPYATLPLEPFRVAGLGFVGSGALAVLAHDGRLMILDPKLHQSATVLQFKVLVSLSLGDRGQAMAVDVSGHRMAVAVDDQVLLLNTQGQLLSSGDGPAHIHHLSWSLDSTTIAATGSSEVHIRDTSQMVRRLPCTGVDASPKGAFVNGDTVWIVGGDKPLVRSLSLASGQERSRIPSR
ncbi:MAG: WD40 repeat domain-containing protein [Myxococcota bacterium]